MIQATTPMRAANTHRARESPSGTTGDIGVAASDVHKKKILFVITKSNWGGAQRYVFDLASGLPRDTWEAVVAFGPEHGSTETGTLGEKLQEVGIRTIFVPELARDIGLADWHAFRGLLRIIRTEAPDVLHLNSSKVGVLGALAGRIAHVPRIVFTAHGWPFREKRNILWRTAAFLGSLATALLAHTTICVSEADRRAFANVPFLRQKLVRIYNGINPHTRFGSGEHIRHSFPTGVSITGTIGELTANKNQAALVMQAAHTPSMYVAIVGEGEERARLETLIAQTHLHDRVRLFGFLPSTEVLKGFDRFSLPSLKEGLPYVLIEARFAGIPIEANRTGGIGEVLDLPLETFTLERMLHETLAQYR